METHSDTLQRTMSKPYTYCHLVSGITEYQRQMCSRLMDQLSAWTLTMVPSKNTWSIEIERCPFIFFCCKFALDRPLFTSFPDEKGLSQPASSPRANENAKTRNEKDRQKQGANLQGLELLLLGRLPRSARIAIFGRCSGKKQWWNCRCFLRCSFTSFQTRQNLAHARRSNSLFVFYHDMTLQIHFVCKALVALCAFKVHFSFYIHHYHVSIYSVWFFNMA